MADVNLYKKTAAPATANPNDIIFVKNGTLVSMYICDIEGTPYGVVPAGDYVKSVNGLGGVVSLALDLTGGALSITGGNSVDLDARYFQKAANLPWTQISGTPTTLGGYGITDAYTKAQVDAVTGSLSNLTTTSKTNLVSAINEINNAVATGMKPPEPIDCSTSPNYPASTKGDTYKVTASGKIGGASGVVVEAGDMIICTATNGGGSQAAVGSSFFIVEANLDSATTSVKGIGRIATQAEVNTGTEDFAWVTPLTLQSKLGGYVPTSRTISAGTGLTGGGNLTANRSFAIDPSYSGFTNYYTKTQADARYLQSFTETDPVWVDAKSASTIISGDWYFSNQEVDFNKTLSFRSNAATVDGMFFEDGSGNKRHFVGTRYSAGNPIIVYNATPTVGSDSWMQGATGSNSWALDIGSGGIQVFKADAGTSAGSFNSFWSNQGVVATQDWTLNNVWNGDNIKYHYYSGQTIDLNSLINGSAGTAHGASDFTNTPHVGYWMAKSESMGASAGNGTSAWQTAMLPGMAGNPIEWWYRGYDGQHSTWSSWYQVADRQWSDGSFVHLSGAEDITGDKRFFGRTGFRAEGGTTLGTYGISGFPTDNGSYSGLTASSVPADFPYGQTLYHSFVSSGSFPDFTSGFSHIETRRLYSNSAAWQISYPYISVDEPDPDVNGPIRYRAFSTNGTAWGPVRTFASREWVSSYGLGSILSAQDWSANSFSGFTSGNTNAPTGITYFGITAVGGGSNTGIQIAGRSSSVNALYWRGIEGGTAGSWLRVLDEPYADTLYAPIGSAHDPLTLGIDKNGLSLAGQVLQLALATTSAAGAMSSTDKTKLNGIDSGANNYTLPTASATVLGGIKVGTTLSISSSVLNAKTATSGALGIVKPGSNMAVDGNGALTMQWAEVEW